MNPKLRLLAAAATAVVAASCTRDSAGPGDRNVSLTIQAGNQQYATPNALLAEPLKVVVTDASTKAPVNGAVVRWRLVQGTGAQIAPASSTTGADGVATTTVRLGGVGDYTIESVADNLVGAAPRFTARAVLAPVIASIIPTTVNAGASLAINGSNFSPIPDENIVLFGGFRARVVTASSNQLGLIVPPCLPSRTLTVQAMLGAVGSNLMSVDVIGESGTPLLLAPGES
ncbi:MAG TPA: IPT/TIG domain-containing protein, partial [Longimicrobiales bacterium]|nr:IPT/TIG domain-containing protein [Longimicrobiales bacterium]